MQSHFGAWMRDLLHLKEDLVSNIGQHARFQRGEGAGGLDAPAPPPPPSLKNHKNIGFLSSTGPEPQKNRKATKLAFHNGPSSARQRNAIEISILWRADDGPLIVVFGSSHLN